MFALVVPLFLGSCTLYRAVRYGNAGIDDYRTFPQDTIFKGKEGFLFVETQHGQRLFDTLRVVRSYGRDCTIDEALADERVKKKLSCGVLLIRNDSIIYEGYQGIIGRDAVSTVFSVSKSLTSLLCGIAVGEGLIKSVDDPVTDYLPELKDADPRFSRLTVGHLLDMRTGLKFKENYRFNIFSPMARLHYGRNMLRQMRHLKFSEEPGTSFSYNSMSTAILGLVIERAAGRPYADYMSEKVWQPLCMENDALISVNSLRKRYPKAYGGISATARDLARTARLYMHGGLFDGRQIVDSAWVSATLSAVRAHENTGSRVHGYSYSMWHELIPVLGSDGSPSFGSKEEAMQRCRQLGLSNVVLTRSRTKYNAYRSDGMFRMKGILGQTVFIDPSRNIILVVLTNRSLEPLVETIFEYL